MPYSFVPSTSQLCGQSRAQQFVEFCDETSFHGFAEWLRSRWMRPFWVLAIVGLSVFLFVNVYIVIHNHVKYPYTTSIQPIHTDSMTLPPVKVCLRSPFSRDDHEKIVLSVPQIARDHLDEPLSVVDLTILKTLNLNFAFSWMLDEIYDINKMLRNPTPSIIVNGILESGTSMTGADYLIQAVVDVLAAWTGTDIIRETAQEFEAVYPTGSNQLTEWFSHELDQTIKFELLVAITVLHAMHEMYFKIETSAKTTRNSTLSSCYSEIMDFPLYGMAEQELDFLYTATLDCIDKHAQHIDYRKRIQPFVTTSGRWDNMKLILESSFPVEKVFKSCLFGSQTLDCRNHTQKTFSTARGVCYEVDVSSLTQLSPGDGLKLLIKLNMDQALAPHYQFADGIQLLLANDARTYHIPTGSLAHVHLTQISYNRDVTYDSEMCQKGQMSDDALLLGNYSYAKCRDNCAHQMTLTLCGCLPTISHELLRNPNRHHSCDLLSRSCVARSRVHELYDHEERQAHQAFKDCVSECKIECLEEVYDASALHREHMGHLFHSSLFQMTEQQLFNDISLLINTPDEFERKMSSHNDYVYVFQDLSTGRIFMHEEQYKQNGVADQADKQMNGKLVEPITTEQLMQNYQSFSVNISFLQDRLTSGHLRLLEGLDESFLHVLHSELRLGLGWNQGHHYDASNLPLALVTHSENIFEKEDLVDVGKLPFYESMTADYVYLRDRHPVSTNYADLKNSHSYQYDLRHEFMSAIDANNASGVYGSKITQQCSASRFQESCAMYRQQVAKKWANDHIMVMVSYPKFERTLIETQQRSTINDVIGSIGGLMGLCLGGSLMSLFHLTVFMFQWTFPKLDDKRNVVVEKQDKDRLVTIDELNRILASLKNKEHISIDTSASTDSWE